MNPCFQGCLPMIDAHAHLEMLLNPEEKIKRAVDGGIELILTIIDPAEKWEQALEIVEKYDFVYFAAGVHPHNARLFKEKSKLLEELLSHPKALAVGEVGLDYHYMHSPAEVQQEAFLRQIELAKEKNKPLIIHTRRAFSNTLKILDSLNAWRQKVLFHCFSEGKNEAEEVFKKGGYASFAGNITYPKAEALREAALALPPDRLFAETDCPFLTPQPRRGEKNEPLYVKFVYELLADLKDVSIEELAERVRKNFLSFFMI